MAQATRTRPPVPAAVQEQTSLVLHRQPQAVQTLFHDVGTMVASIIPKALKGTTPAQQQDRLVWAMTTHALADALGVPDTEMLVWGIKHVAVIAGAPVLSAEALRKLLIVNGHEIVLVESTNKGATVKGRRYGSSEWSTATFAEEDAAAAGYFDIEYVKWGKDENQNSVIVERWCEREYDVVTGKMITNDRAKAPDWVQRPSAKRSWKENWYRQKLAMYIARASAVVCRIVDPLPTVGGLTINTALMVEPTAGDNPANVARVDLSGGENVIDVDSEEVTVSDSTPSAPLTQSDGWADQWRSAIRTAGLTAADSKAIIRFTSDGRVEMAQDLEEVDRPYADQTLEHVTSGRWSIIDGKVEERSAA